MKIEQWNDGQPCINQAELMIAKHRNGSLNDIRLKFIGKYAKFSNLDEFENMPDTITVQSKMNEDDSFEKGEDDLYS